MLPQQYCLRWKYHHSNLQTMFSQLLDRGCFCDVTLACEGQLIRAHRVVLCACSTFFDTVLTNYASERDPIIIMKDVTYADVKCLIEFMYKGEINVEHAHLASLLRTADDLKIKGLAEVTWRDEEEAALAPQTAVADYNPYDHHPHHHHNRVSPHSERERKSSSPSVPSSLLERPPQHMPTLTPMPVANSIAVAASPVDYYLGPKRKRGRPPLDDTYDVFNVRKMSHISGHMEHQAYLETQHHYVEEHRQHTVTTTSPPTSSAAVVAYQHHLQQQRLRQQHSESEDAEQDDPQADPEWISSKLEVNVSECEHTTIEHENDDVESELKIHKVEPEKSTGIVRKLEKKPKDCSLEQCKDKAAIERVSRKNSKEGGDKAEHAEEATDLVVTRDSKTDIKKEESDPPTVSQTVEEMENSKTPSVSVGTSPTVTISATGTGNTQPPPQPPPTALHSHFGKFGPEGYLVNEHGMLMPHDFVHTPVVSIPASITGAGSSTGSSAANSLANGGNDSDFIDIKMEDYDAADLRLTSEEMTQWQDVIRMDDYLAKGRRPQFWEEPFTKRVLDAIKNKRLEMKKAARILGVSYGTLYGRYREVYGCLKHPYSNTTFRPSQPNPLSVQPRFDIVWPTGKRDGQLLPAQISEIGKIRPKDLSELWARPQM